MASKKTESTALTNTNDARSDALALATGTDILASVLQEGDVIDETGTEELSGDARIPRWAFNLSTITNDEGKPEPVVKTVFVQTVSGAQKKQLRLQVITDHKSRQWKKQIDGKGVVICTSWDGVTGRMPETNTERPCKGCPDYAWAKDAATGKNTRSCGDVHNVVAVDLDTADVGILVVKRTSIRPWRDFYSRHFHKQRSVRDPQTKLLRKVDVPFYALETHVTLELKTRGSESWAEPVFKVGEVLPRDLIMSGQSTLRDFRDTLLQAAAKVDAVESAASEGGEGGGDTSFDFGENRDEKSAAAASGMR